MSDIKDEAARYIADGWAVVPLVSGEKRASSSWQKKVYGPDHFRANDGIAGKCGEPSGWRVDVDCDARESVIAAKILLPHTQLIHGRPGKPDSHYWYRCEGIKTTQFTDIKGATGTQMLVEIRSTGSYTMLPPSTWTDKNDPSRKEQLGWALERAPMVILADPLSGVVRSLAVATLMGRHWPGSGGRHTTIGHLAGFLCHAGLHPREVLKVIEASVRAAGDTDLNDRLNFAKHTIGRFENDEQVTGAPKLAEEMGDAFAAKLRSWFKQADTDALETMNATHFFVRLGKDSVIGREDTAKGEVVFQKARELHIEYANRQVVVGIDGKGRAQFKPLFTAWLEYDKRRAYREVVFSPPPLLPDPQDYNLWRGFAVEPQAGDCQLFLDHIKTVICSGNDEHYTYLMNLLALTVQEPGTPSEVAVVLRGESGTGKGVFARAVCSLFGRHAIHIDKVDHLVGKFNTTLSSKVVVFADEAFWAGDKSAVGGLKRLITEPTLTIERKGIDPVEERNCVHLFMATNEDWAVPAMLKERRFFALEVSSVRLGDVAYFDSLHAQLKAGGLAAFLAHLLALPVDRGLVRRLPRTQELRNQQNQSLSDELKFWQECLIDGRIGLRSWDAVLRTDDLDRAYREWANRQRVLRPLAKAALCQKLTKYISEHNTRTCRIGKEYGREWALRPLANAREYFDRQLGTTTEWDEPSGAREPF